MPLQNVYYHRTAGTPRPCYICKRPTQAVLATLQTDDFLYTCEGHLSDPGFATLIPPPGPSAADVQQVITDYKKREADRAKAKKDAKEKDKDGKDATDGKDKDKDSTQSPKASPSPAPSPAPAPAAPSHKKYALHRQVFEMRKAEQRRKEQGVKAREVGAGLPQVPRGAF